MTRPEDYAATKLHTLLDPEGTETNTHATGPRTPEGKKRSSQNALRHGLSGRVVVLPTEDMAQYLRLSKEIVDSLYPETQLERDLAQAVADGMWRQKRFNTVEEAMLALGHYEGEGDFDAEHENIHAAFTAAKAFRSNPQAFATLSIYQQRIQRGIDKSMKMLLDLQTRREERRKSEIHQVLRLRDFNKMLDAHAEALERDQDGQLVPAKVYQRAELLANEFVYSFAQVEREADRRDCREQAKMAERCRFNYEEFRKMAA
jgi:hypothetical protein